MGGEVEMVKTGLERILDGEYPSLKKAKLGLIINHTSVDHQLRLSVEQLLQKGYYVQAIFAPEHGFRGGAIAGKALEHEIDQRTKLPVYSLYGTSKRPTVEMLKGLDALVFDMQDLGVRFYTYIYTMANTMEEAAKQGIEYYVLDRPNPIMGTIVEGNLIDSTFSSFVGNYGLPIRHGMTIGELARYINEEYKIGCSLHVIEMENWKRSDWYDQSSLQWVMPSPNATEITMAALYPGTCLFEGTNVSEGRGTTKPFEVIGAPWIEGETWLEELMKYQLKGVLFRPIYFTPFTSKYQGEACRGVQVHVVDREQLQPIQVALAMIESLKKLYPSEFEWSEPYKGRYFIDLLMGTDQFRYTIDHQLSVLEWLKKEEESLARFQKIRRKYLLY
jgi:uncharacterized protein YbbC (DUF1343 family)